MGSNKSRIWKMDDSSRTKWLTDLKQNQKISITWKGNFIYNFYALSESRFPLTGSAHFNEIVHSK